MKMNKTKVLWWAVCLLIVLNATTVATIMYHNSQKQNREQKLIIEIGTMAWSQQCFHDVLGFSPEQMAIFCPKHQTFKSKAKKIVSQISDEKQAMFEKLQQSDPNVEKLSQRSENIGRLHAELRQITAIFYMDIGKICNTPQQRKKLSKIFKPLFLDESHAHCDKHCRIK